MNLYLIAIIKVNKKKKYRVINIGDKNTRSITNGITTYRFLELDPTQCCNHIIGGLRRRSDKCISFREAKNIPVIDVIQETVINENSILQCSTKIFVNYKGEKILFNKRPANAFIIDIRLPKQKASYNWNYGSKKEGHC